MERNGLPPNGIVVGDMMMKMRHEFTQTTSEAYRLKTFRTWPAWSPVDPTDLAKAGFFYIGVGDRARCFSCHGDLVEWKDGDKAMEEHKKFYPTCPFLNGIGRRNKPMGKDYAGCHYSTGSDETDSSESSSDEASSPPPKTKGSEYKQHHDGLMRFENYVKGNGFATQQHFRDKKYHVLSPKRSGNAVGLEEYVKGVRSELYRLRTFDNWPAASPLRPSELAQAGFFYLGFGDRVQCFSCRGQIKDWEDTDTAMGEHQRHFPQCSFVRMLQGHYVPPQVPKTEITPRGQARIPKVQSQLNERRMQEKERTLRHQVPERKRLAYVPIHRHTRTYSSSSDEDRINERPVRRPSGNVAVKPRSDCKHPRYDAVSARLDSFEKRDCPLRLNTRGSSSQSLASAGFFYTGLNDVCSCFHCGVTLRGWGPNSDPWAEHAMWYPTCEWLGLRKTKAFIETVRSCTTTPVESLSEQMEKLTISDRKETKLCHETSKSEQRRSTSSPRLVAKGIAKVPTPLPETIICKICLDKKADTVFLPCKHLVTCGFCACSLDHCIVCHQEIRDCVYTFHQTGKKVISTTQE